MTGVWKTINGNPVLIKSSNTNDYKNTRKLSGAVQKFQKTLKPRYLNNEKKGAGPATCPICSASVYFIRAWNGGSFWCDSLGWPWPKHPCMDDINRQHNCYRKDISHYDLKNATKNIPSIKKESAVLCTPSSMKFHYEMRNGKQISITDIRLDMMNGKYVYVRILGHECERIFNEPCILAEDSLSSLISHSYRENYQIIEKQIHRNGEISKSLKNNHVEITDKTQNKVNKTPLESEKTTLPISNEVHSKLEEKAPEEDRTSKLWTHFKHLLSLVVCKEKTIDIARFLARQTPEDAVVLCSAKSKLGSFSDIFQQNILNQWIVNQENLGTRATIQIIKTLQNPFIVNKQNDFMKPKLIIFDWDGTLADTTGPIIKTMQAAFEENGLDSPAADEIRPFIGYSLARIVASLAPHADEAMHEKLVHTYAGHYLNPNNHNMRLFDSALPCLETLKQQGYWLAVATGKGRTGLDGAIAQTHTDGYWLATRCASECPSKPAPDMVLELCDAAGLRPSETLVVGDTTFDLEMAANAGARAVAVATGAHSAAQLQNAPCLAVLNSLNELPAFLHTL